MRRIIAAQAQQRRKAGATAAAATAGPRVGRGATQASGADAPLCQKPQLEPEPEVPPPVSGSGVGVASGGKDLSLRSSDDPDFGVSYWRRSRRIMRATATPHGPHHTCSSSSSSGGVGGDGDTSRATWLQAAHEGPVSSRSVGGGEAAWTAQPEPMLLVETSSESSCGRERGSINTHHTDSRRRTGSSRVVTLSPASSRSLSGNDEDVSSAQSSSGVSMAHVQSSLPPSLSQQHKKDGEPLAELSRPHGPPESPVSIQQQQQQQQQQLLQPPEIRPLELEHVHGRHPAPSASIPSSRRHPAVEWLERGGAVFGLRQGGPAVECPVMLRW
jgi:hypothetical protein